MIRDLDRRMGPREQQPRGGLLHLAMAERWQNAVVAAVSAGAYWQNERQKAHRAVGVGLFWQKKVG